MHTVSCTRYQWSPLPKGRNQVKIHTPRDDAAEKSTISRLRRLEDEWPFPVSGTGLAADIWSTFLVARSPLADAAVVPCPTSAQSAATPSASARTVVAATATAVWVVPASATGGSATADRRQGSHDQGEQFCPLVAGLVGTSLDHSRVPHRLDRFVLGRRACHALGVIKVTMSS